MNGKITRRALRLAAIAQEVTRKAWRRSREGEVASGLVRSPEFARIGDQALRIAITGGARGVGFALADGLARSGARVAIMARSAEKAETAAETIGSGALGLEVDVSDPDSIERAFDRTADAFDGIDILINNAGITGPLGKGADGISAADFSQVLAVNAAGAYLAARSAALHMTGGGRILNVSSGAVDRTETGMGAYAVSKHALEGITRQLASDLADRGICVCSIRLGSLRTDMTAAAFGPLKASLLPDPASVLPAFQALIAAPSRLINGRSFAAWRLLADPTAEIYTTSPLSMSRPFSYPAYVHEGHPVSREDGSFRIYDRAENRMGPSPKVAKVLRDNLSTRPIAVYPDERHQRLRDALAKTLDLAPDSLAIGNGSWEVLDRLLEIFTAPGDQVVASKPGWFGFKMLADKRALSVTRVPMARDRGRLHHNLASVAACVTPATRLIYLISPSNPEGIVLRRDDMLRFLDTLPPGLPLLLDEAYLEYCDDPDAVSARELLHRTERPIFGLRTFSKFHGLASMRVGYAYGRPEVMTLLDRGERIFNIAHLAELAAVTALRDRDWQAHVFETNRRERYRLQEGFAQLGLDHIPSQAPYILVEIPCDLKRTIATFAKHRIFLGEKAFYKGKFMLFPVSTAEENRKHLDLLSECLGRAG